MIDYFTEVFPIEIDKIGQLSAFDVETSKGTVDAVANALVERLTRAFSGYWVWYGGYLITNNPPAPVQLEITLDVLKQECPALYGNIDTITENMSWHPTVEDAANFIAMYCTRVLDTEIRQYLRLHGVRIHNGYVMRDYVLRGWEVDGQPALSMQLQSRVLYIANAQKTFEKDYNIVGLTVIDKTNAQNIGTITGFAGTINKQRQNLLDHMLSAEMKSLVEAASNDEQVVTVSFPAYERNYLASALNIILETENYSTFGIDPAPVSKAEILAPADMAKIISTASDVLKEHGFIGKAFNNRANEKHFIYLDHVPEMEFGNKTVRPYKIESLATEFVRNGLFANHPRFKEQAIRIAVINTLEGTIATDFIEAMRRRLEKEFGFEIEMIKERTVRVVSDKNLASAVRVVEKENPHVLMACFEDEATDSYDYVHSLTLGKGIALQALYEKTMHNPDAMDWVIMGILAKTGNIPFVLAEPLDAANLVVGLDWVHETMTRGQRVVGISRVYRRDGFFMRYFMDIQELEDEQPIPKSVIKALFPKPIFAGRRVLIHHQGEFQPSLVMQLEQWAQDIQAEFLLVEIHTDHVPHLYGLSGGIIQAPWGSAFLLNVAEAYVISSQPAHDLMPETIHIRIRSGDLSIEQAIYSVLALTLLSYGTTQLPRLPVTIHNGDKLSYWLARGMLPEYTNGDVAFWL